MFDFGIFCHLLRLIMGIYRVGGRPGIWKVSFSLFFSSLSFSFLFFSSFSFLPCLFLFFSFLFFSFLFFSFLFFSFLFFSFLFLFFIFFFGLSRGPLYLRAPGHCPSMPPSRYATDLLPQKSSKISMFCGLSQNYQHLFEK